LLINQRLGTAEYDVILQPLLQTEPDIVIEIKYIRQGFKYGWLRESVMRLAVATELYAARLDRRCLPVLLVVFASEDAPLQWEFQQLRRRVQQDFVQRGLAIRVEYIKEKAISAISCEELRHLVEG
jgi:hypothetical protein